MEASVKNELLEIPISNVRKGRERNGVVSYPPPGGLIELSSDSDSDSDVDVLGENSSKKRKTNDVGIVLPIGFLSPLPPPTALPQPPAVLSLPAPNSASALVRSDVIANFASHSNGCKQFWKAGDFDGPPSSGLESSTVGMDHVRVHPKFLHSNATSHKWALGAFAELLDNSLDEVCNGATYVNVDRLVSKKDGTRMLLIEDNGGGMDPDKMRQCMSLGYSEKSKLANTIGQYGNGFKTSTMRLGADVIVFSRSQGKDGKSSTQSIGLLSYTFLRNTGKEDIVVPMLDYEGGGIEWNRIVRTSTDDWNKNVDTIVHWSPFYDEADLLRQFNLMKDHGTRVIIYNLWEDDQGQLELDFDTDPHDIQIRGVNRDEKNIQMAKEFPNSRHFLTYRHSLRSYASILYLRLPPGFRIILRGKDIVHHNIVNDMMMSQEVTYRPQSAADGFPKDSNMVAAVTIGFVKDAVHHIDVSGFNVYHKNRLIKPFWRIWNPAGSGGRGVIGVLEANFVEPAHDKQGFERTLVLSRLESKLIQMQKNYWGSNCDRIGYASIRKKKQGREYVDRETSPEHVPESSRLKRQYSAPNDKGTPLPSDKMYLQPNQRRIRKESEKYTAYMNGRASASPNSRIPSSPEQSSSAEDDSDQDIVVLPKNQAKGSSQKISHAEKSHENENLRLKDTTTPSGKTIQSTRASKLKGQDVYDGEQVPSNSELLTMQQLKEENSELKKRLERKEDEILVDVMQALQHEKDMCKSLETQLRAAEKKIEDLNKEQETLIDVFSEERDRRDGEEKVLRKKLQDASNTIQELLDKVRRLERKCSGAKPNR
ncbi:putative histidine kinase-like ATPase domain-containing protein [Lupinus albus]|uniref:Putative histidine kinase-like ATPase domain-containing protein n=1 Tax=Lupinus albus TaxID=3870 RepID=A0A6A4PIJ7_LUPAL|nr:putative histidine kinase-like ATPase domain-containing protein [Lupinus albus]